MPLLCDIDGGDLCYCTEANDQFPEAIHGMGHIHIRTQTEEAQNAQ